MDVTKFSQILLLYSEAINTVFYFCEDSRYFCLSNVSPVRRKKNLLSQAANPELTIGIKQSHHHISHNTTRQIKDFANAASMNEESAAGSTRCDGDWLQRSLSRNDTPRYHFHVYCGKNQIQFQISAKAALVGLLH